MKRRIFIASLATLPLGVQMARAASHAAPVNVKIESFAFSPSTVEISVGQTVTWTNMDGARHSATADGGSFDTGLLRKNASGSVTFDKPGTYSYFCLAHPGMKGTVVVK